MHKAVQEVKEKHVYQKVLMEKINIEKGSSTGGDKESESADVGMKEKGDKRKAIVTVGEYGLENMTIRSNNIRFVLVISHLSSSLICSLSYPQHLSGSVKCLVPMSWSSNSNVEDRGWVVSSSCFS